jgi:choline dehydrogenase-like flavoprotein
MEFDYVVVGAGAAGCAVARRLSADPRARILLIEYGGRDVNPLIHIPKGFYYTLRGSRYLYRYETKNHEVWLRGRVLGGSTAVNGMMWMRGAPADWDDLAQRGNEGWGWDDIRPAYQAIEEHVHISITATSDPVASAILESAKAYGWTHVPDVNSSDRERIGYTPSTVRDGRRVTAYRALCRSVRNITVWPRTRAISVLFDGQRATGVRIRQGTAIRDVKARREVIVSAGAIETPMLLERSGIGRPQVLRTLGVSARAESPNVGERLIEQRGLALQVALKSGPAPHIVRETLRYFLNGQGLLSTAGYDLVAQFASSPGLSRPDVQGLFVPMALDTSSEEMKLARHPGILFMGYPIRPSTTSTVHASGPSPDDPPVIDARFLETEADRAAAGPVLDIARGVLGEGPVAGLVAAEEFPGPSVTGPEAAVEYSRQTGTGIYHAVGSAAMGPSGDDVVDARLRVRGIEGLRVADASVLPFQVSGNTAAPAMAVGWRAGDFILADA